MSQRKRKTSDDPASTKPLEALRPSAECHPGTAEKCFEPLLEHLGIPPVVQIIVSYVECVCAFSFTFDTLVRSNIPISFNSDAKRAVHDWHHVPRYDLRDLITGENGTISSKGKTYSGVFNEGTHWRECDPIQTFLDSGNCEIVVKPERYGVIWAQDLSDPRMSATADVFSDSSDIRDVAGETVATCKYITSVIKRERAQHPENYVPFGTFLDWHVSRLGRRDLEWIANRDWLAGDRGGFTREEGYLKTWSLLNESYPETVQAVALYLNSHTDHADDDD